MRLGPTVDGAKQMAAIIPLHQTSKWAKRDNLPPTRQRNQMSRAREYLTADEVERIVWPRVTPAGAWPIETLC